MTNINYWNVLYRSFVAFVFLGVISSILTFMMGGLDQFTLLIYALFIIINSILAGMFKSKSAKAIITTYIIFGIILILNLTLNLIYPTTFNGGIAIGYILQLYILECARRAKRQSLTPIQPDDLLV